MNKNIVNQMFRLDFRRLNIFLQGCYVIYYLKPNIHVSRILFQFSAGIKFKNIFVLRIRKTFPDLFLSITKV